MKKPLIILSIFLTQHTFATTYYISTSGSTGNSGTSTGSPWPLSKVSSFTYLPGDTILLKRGDSFTGTITIPNGGALGNNIVIGAYGTGARPIITAASNSPCITVTAANRGYWTIDNLDLRSSGQITSINMVCSIYFNYWPSDVGAVPGWIIQNCNFNSSIFVSGPNTVIQNCNFNATGDSAVLGAICIRNTNGDGSIVQNDTISNYSDRGVWFMQGAANVIVRNNVIHDIIAGADQNGVGINSDGSSLSGGNPNGKIYGNLIYNCGYGISHENANDDTTYNNIIHDCEIGMTSYFYTNNYNIPSNIFIHNNLVYNVQYGFALWHTRDISFVNNTLVNGTSTTPAAFLQNTDTANVRNIIFTNNIISGTWTYPVWNYLSDAIFTQFDYNDIVPAGTTIYRVNGNSKTLAQAQSLGFMTHGIISDPLLTGTYQLQPGSPAINAGVSIGLPYNGSTPDIGAYETSYGKKFLKYNGKILTHGGKALTITQ